MAVRAARIPRPPQSGRMLAFRSHSENGAERERPDRQPPGPRRTPRRPQDPECCHAGRKTKSDPRAIPRPESDAACSPSSICT